MTSETRPLADVTGVKLASIGAVEVIVGTDESIVIEAEDNLIPFITTEVSEGVLTIGTRDETSLEPTRSIRFTVTVGRVELADISGAGTLSIDDPENDRIDLSVPGAGTISVSAEVDQSTASISGTGAVEAARLAADDVIVEVSGAGTATAWALNTLDVTLSGVGNVFYWGEPTVDQPSPHRGFEISGCPMIGSVRRPVSVAIGWSPSFRCSRGTAAGVKGCNHRREEESVEGQRPQPQVREG